MNPPQAVRIVLGFEVFHLPFRVIGEHDFERFQHRHDARRGFVEFLAQAEVAEREVDRAVGFGDADALAELADRRRREPAPSQSADRRHPWIVPSIHHLLRHQLQQLAFAEDGIGQVEARELVLPRMEHAEGVEAPVVERAVVFKFQCTDGVGDALDAVRLPVRPVVHRVDAPVAAGAVVLGVEDAVQHRIAQVQVGRGHIDFGAQDFCAVRELPFFMRSNRSRFSATGRSRCGLFLPGSESVPRYSRISSALRSST